MANGEYALIVPSLNGGTPLLTDPYGNPVPLGGSTTTGLQEAVDAAWANAANVNIIGAAGPTGPVGGPGNFVLTKPWQLCGSTAISHPSSMQIRCNGATFYWPAGVTTGIIVDSCSILDLEAMAASFVFSDPNVTGVVINPTRSTDFTVVVNSATLRFGFFLGPGATTPSTAMHISSTVSGATGVNACEIVLGSVDIHRNQTMKDAIATNAKNDGVVLS